MIHGVIFDLGWTLMYYNANPQETNPMAARKLADFLRAHHINVGDDFPSVFQAAREARWKRADETHIEQLIDDALRDALAHYGYTESLDGLVPRAVRVFYAEHEARWLAYPDALDTLRALTARGLRVGLYSNADDDGLVRHCVERLGFAPYLDPVLSSAMPHRIRKPDPRALLMIATAWQLPPSTIVMVGDAPQYDVLGARRAGMRAIHIARDDAGWWQKIPADHTDDPAYHADVVVKSLSEIVNVIEKF
ncbi:MAG: HAD family hydrolase [Anaerolineae bacterium]|nr:HAD family hydrolase [Anaerolineae bacterium]